MIGEQCMIFDIWKDIKKGKLDSVYLLVGKESFLLQETTQKIIEAALQEEEKDFNLSTYDMEEVLLETAIEDVETLPFIGDKRVVVVKNPYFLTSEKKKEKIEHNLGALEQYLQSPAPYSILIFYAPYEKLDERKKITKLLKKQSIVVEMNSLSDKEAERWVHHLTEGEGVELDEDALEQLLLLTAGDLLLINEEIKKLSTYVGENGKITKEIVRNLVSRTLDQNIFELIENVVHKNSKEALKIFYDLLKTNEEPIKILSLLATQFRLILQVKELSKNGYGQQQIANTIKVHPFRVKLAFQQANLFHEEELANYLIQLAEADYEIKTGKIDKQLILELFLLKLFNK